MALQAQPLRYTFATTFFRFCARGLGVSILQPKHSSLRLHPIRSWYCAKGEFFARKRVCILYKHTSNAALHPIRSLALCYRILFTLNIDCVLYISILLHRKIRYFSIFFIILLLFYNLVVL